MQKQMTQPRKFSAKIICLPNKKPTPDKREWAKQAIVWGPEGGAGPSPLVPIGTSQNQARWFLILCLPLRKKGHSSHTRRTSLVV